MMGKGATVGGVLGLVLSFLIYTTFTLSGPSGIEVMDDIPEMKDDFSSHEDLNQYSFSVGVWTVVSLLLASIGSITGNSIENLLKK